MKQRSPSFFVAAIFLFLIFSLQPARASTWSSTTIDNSTAESGKYCSMAVDPSGKLHVGYLDTNGSFLVLKYANNAGGTWTTESLQAYINDIVGANTSTVYTPGGPRIMAYSQNQATGQYKYQAVRKIPNDGWQLQDIAGGKWPFDTNGEDPGGWDQMPISSIAPGTKTGAIQKEGFTYITFSDGNMLWFANEKTYAYNYFAGTGPVSTGAVSQSDLAADTSGVIHIVSYNPSAGPSFGQGLLHSVGSAAPEVVLTGVARNPVIAIDKDKTLHVAYVDADFNIKYINKPDGGSWSPPVTVGSVLSLTGGDLSLKADKSGGLHLSYYSKATTGAKRGELNYANRTSAGTWLTPELIPEIGNSTDYGQYTSLVVNDNNVVSIVYYDVKRSKLCVSIKSTGDIDVDPAPVYFGNVQQGGAFAVTKNVTVTNRGLASLTLAASNPVRLSANTSANEFSISPTNNTCTISKVLVAGGTCSFNVVLTASSPGAKTGTLEVNSNDPVMPSRSVALSGMSEVNPTTNITINASVGTGGSISPSGNVPVAYYANQSFTITPGPGFLVQSVTIDGVNVGTLTSYEFVEVVANRTISVSFAPVVPVAMWQVTEVDNTATNTGKYCSLANDNLGKLYVGYMDTTIAGAPVLKYATNNSGPWVQQAVTTIPSVTESGTATVFSEGVGPRIMAYSYDSTTGIRKFGAARKWTEQAPSGGYLNDWQLQWIAGDVFPEGSPGGMSGAPQPSIFNTTTTTFTGATQFVDPSGNPFTFISFTDGYHLWYANEMNFWYRPFEYTPGPTQNPPWPTSAADQGVANAGNQSDLVLDPSGVIHIVYYTPGVDGLGHLRYGTGSGGIFGGSPSYSESDIRTSEIVSDPSIAIDGKENLHVGYVQGGRVKYVNKPKGSSTWSEPYDLGPCGSAGAFTSIEANGLNIVHVAYYSNNGSGIGNLMYAQRYENGSWTIPAPVWATGQANGSNIGQYAALVVDEHHNVNIAYYDGTNTSLKVAKKLIPVIQVTPDSLQGQTVVPIVLTAGGSQIFTVKDAGTVSLKVGTAVFSGTDASHFSMNASGCNGQTLAPNATCTITVTADSTLTTGMTASLDIPSDDPYSSIKSIALQAPVVASGPVKVGSNFYATLTEGYAASTTGNTIQSRNITFLESLSCYQPRDIILGGGYDSDFASQIGATIIKGSLEIMGYGRVEAQYIGLE